MSGWQTLLRHPIRLTVLILSIAVVGWSIFGDDGIAESWELRKAVIAAQQRSDSLREESSLLKERISALRRNDKFASEFAAREIGMIKPGERVYKTVELNKVGE